MNDAWAAESAAGRERAGESGDGGKIGAQIIQHALEFLTPLKVSKLHGVGKVMEARLAGLGISTVGDLRDYGQDALEASFGRWGRRLHELSRGIDDHPITTDQPTQSISSEDTFAADLPITLLGPAIHELAAKTWASAIKDERIGRTVVLKLKTADFKILTRSLTPQQPPASVQTLTEIALTLRTRVQLSASVRFRLVGVGLAHFCDRDQLSAQQQLFE